MADPLLARVNAEARRRYPGVTLGDDDANELPSVGIAGLRAFSVFTSNVVPPIVEVVLAIGEDVLWPDVALEERLARVFACAVGAPAGPEPRALAHGLLLARSCTGLRLLAAGEGGIPVDGDAQAREVKALGPKIARPSVARDGAGWTATFVTWHPSSGDVLRHDVRFDGRARATATTTAVARGVGRFLRLR